jgi:predicted tellurium resistance membrane protein TerC
MNIADQFHELLSLHGLASLLMLAVLELVLGIDNIIFISIVISKLPEKNRLSARVVGLGLALVMRIFMLFGLVWLSQITTTLVTIAHFNISVKDVLFLFGGAYLAWGTYNEIHDSIKGKVKEKQDIGSREVVFRNAIMQIVMVDALFSFDSIFTAIGLMRNFVIMAFAVILGMVFMLWLSGKISAFINKYPSIKLIALSFIAAISLLLMFAAFHIELPKKYIYIGFFAAFAGEMINIQLKKSKNK